MSSSSEVQLAVRECMFPYSLAQVPQSCFKVPQLLVCLLNHTNPFEHLCRVVMASERPHLSASIQCLHPPCVHREGLSALLQEGTRP